MKNLNVEVFEAIRGDMGSSYGLSVGSFTLQSLKTYNCIMLKNKAVGNQITATVGFFSNLYSIIKNEANIPTANR